MPHIARRRAALTALAVAIIAAVIVLDLPSAVAQSDEQTGRIVARRLDDGRTEFGWQSSDGARILPSARYFPANVDHRRWLRSSPVEVAGEPIGRINARLTDDGRIEFAFTPTGGERILPPARYFPAAARVGRWLRSTKITWNDASRFIAVSAGLVYTCGLAMSAPSNAGEATMPANQMRPAVALVPSAPAGVTPAGCAKTAPSNVGDIMGRARLTHRGDASAPSAPAGVTPAGCAKTAPSNVGGLSGSASLTHRGGASPPSARVGSTPAGCAATALSSVGASWSVNATRRRTDSGVAPYRYYGTGPGAY